MLLGTNSHVWLLCRRAGTYFGVPAREGELVAIAGTGFFTTRPVEEFTGEETAARGARLWNVTGLGLLSGRLVLADSGFRRIREIDETGKIRTIAGGGTDSDGLGIQAKFDSLRALSVAPDGSLYVVDRARIVRLSR